MIRTLLFCLVTSFVVGQCNSASPPPGTVCGGPLTVLQSPGQQYQNGVDFFNNGLPAKPPTAGEFLLSIVSDQIMASFNGQPYVSIIGPPGPQGEQGIQGPPGPTWSPIGHVLQGTLSCQKGKGTVPAGFVSTCTFTITGML